MASWTEFKNAVMTADKKLRQQHGTASPFRTLQVTPVWSKPTDIWKRPGGQGIVFKVEEETTGQIYALKCFCNPAPDMEERFRVISEDLAKTQGTKLVSYIFLPDELTITDKQGITTTNAVLQMDFLGDDTLRKALKEAAAGNDVNAIRHYLQEFDELITFLKANDMAHGDLKPQNLIVLNGKLIAIDLDGMCTPTLVANGAKSIEGGTPEFQHPLRDKDPEKWFGRNLDFFSIVVIRAAFLGMIHQPTLFKKYDTTDNMVFRPEDFKDPQGSEVFQTLRNLNDAELNAHLDAIEESLRTGDVLGENIVVGQPAPQQPATATPPPVQPAAATPPPVQPAAATPPPAPPQPAAAIPPPPIAAFTASVASGPAPLRVVFTNLSQNASGWEINFGDGAPPVQPAQKTITYTYQNPGTFTPAVTAWGAGTASAAWTLPVAITVQAPAPPQQPVTPVIPPPSAFFGMNWIGNIAPVLVNFDGPTQGVTAWEWDFGNGQRSTSQNPANIYEDAGTYKVTLKVTGPGGTATAVKKIKVRKPAEQRLHNQAIRAIKPKFSYRWLYAAFVAAAAAAFFLT